MGFFFLTCVCTSALGIFWLVDCDISETTGRHTHMAKFAAFCVHMWGKNTADVFFLFTLFFFLRRVTINIGCQKNNAIILNVVHDARRFTIFPS